MLLRILPFALWLSVSSILFLWAVSDFMFGPPNKWQLFLKRAAICFIWPLAVLSGSGRDVIFDMIKGDKTNG